VSVRIQEKKGNVYFTAEILIKIDQFDGKPSPHEIWKVLHLNIQLKLVLPSRSSIYESATDWIETDSCCCKSKAFLLFE